MYAAMVTASIPADQLDAARQLYQERILPIAQQNPGFKSITMLVNRQTNQMVIVVLFETEADARAIETSGRFQQAIELMAPFLTSRPTREVYEVVLQA
jgi:heme-degrading monooxygenase HmoA